MIRVGLSCRILEPRELGLRGFRTLPPPSTGQDLIGHGPWPSSWPSNSTRWDASTCGEVEH